MGLLDLAAPLLGAFDDVLAWGQVPALVRLVVYGIASGWASMAVYRLCSKQDELKAVGDASRALRADLASYDGPFDGLTRRVRALLALSLRHLGLSAWPAFLAGLPMLFVLPWLSNTFGVAPPGPGTVVQLRVVDLAVPASELNWSSGNPEWDPDTKTWTLAWPRTEAPQHLLWKESPVLTLPIARPSEVVHKYQSALNFIISNPAGYLPDWAPMEEIRFKLRSREFIGFGPSWLRGWLAIYLIMVVGSSLILRWIWKLQ